MWNFITNTVILLIVVQQVEKLVNIFVKRYGESQSHRFSINGVGALLENKKFLKMVGINSGAEGNSYDTWTKTEQDKWEKSKFEAGISLDITYLPSENAYFISTENKPSQMVLRNNENEIIYSEIIAGDKEGLDENIEFGIYEKSGGFMKRCSLVPYFRHSKGGLRDDSDKFIQLCEFPHLPLLSDGKYKKLGFEVKKMGGDDWYEDDFKEGHSLPVMKTYRKNGVEFNFVF